MELIDIDGETYRILGRGAEDDQGRVYMHLASERRFTEQTDGRRCPAQIAAWVDPSKVYEMVCRTPPPFIR